MTPPAISDGVTDGPARRTIDVPGLRLAVHLWGDPAKPPLILLHGGRDHARSWDRVARVLADRYSVVVPDLRGHGESDWHPCGRYPMEEYVLDLATIVDDMGLAPVTIVAHSLGGNIAIRYTGALPGKVRRLVAIEGLGFSPKQLAKRDAETAPERLRDWIERTRATEAKPARRPADLADAMARLAEANPGFDADLIRHLAVHATRVAEDGALMWRHDRRILSVAPFEASAAQQHQLWGAITCPTLLIYGTASGASNPLTDGRAEKMPAARVALIEGAGHWVQHDRPEAFMAVLEDFLAEG
ncbi:alpha/beta hydrolase [Sphingomonas naphthae]|uniref:Alpha/beta hydrolase n=1 Tax=Sphingomonas naphthae TaxID=1813468 RepID=A0ABY7TIX1_9SPHN|nr:alpha/beta hydrolase [Sphingomonas naphthae]WCT73145.1 alpha/beta hydrolase [Sphingomonas naphthae]